MSALIKTDTERAMDYATVIAVSGDACTAPNATFGWERHTRLEGRIIGMNTFGASAPLKELQTKFGFQPNLVAEAAKQTAPEEISHVSGISPRALHRSVLDCLQSHGSCHPVKVATFRRSPRAGFTFGRTPKTQYLRTAYRKQKPI